MASLTGNRGLIRRVPDVAQRPHRHRRSQERMDVPAGSAEDGVRTK